MDKQQIIKEAVLYDAKALPDIHKFYGVDVDDTGVTLKVEGKHNFLSFNSEHTIYLYFGGQRTPVKVEASKLARDLAPLKWEEVRHRYEDARTEAYLEATRRKIGLVKTDEGWDGYLRKDQVEYHLDIWVNLTGSGKVDCGKIPGGRWVAEYSYRTDIDDYTIVSHIFEDKPTRHKVLTAELLIKIEMYFLKHGYDKATFQCWECGCNTHWLDVDARGLEQKWEKFLDSYCGC